jgi:hypothetical protein
VAQQYLADIAERQSKHQFTGFASVGAGWQSNANTGPDATTLRALGQPVNRPPSAAPSSDFRFFGAGKVQHSYDLDAQDDAHLVSTMTGYGNAYSRFSRQDVLLGEVTTGVRFKPAPADDGDLYIRPHVIGNYISLDGGRYSDTIGAGLDVTKSWSDRFVTELTLEYRYSDYANIPTLVDNQAQTGYLKVAKLRLAYEFKPGSVLLTDLIYSSQATKQQYYDNTRYEVLFTYSHDYVGPFEISSGAWNVSPYFGLVFRNYAGPDTTTAAVDSTKTRLDHGYRIGIGNSIPIADNWSCYQTVEHIWSDSNIPNFTYQDTAVVVGLSRRF